MDPPVTRYDILRLLPILWHKGLVGVEIRSSAKFSGEESNPFIRVIFVLY
jgi:hypothetical protein